MDKINKILILVIVLIFFSVLVYFFYQKQTNKYLVLEEIEFSDNCDNAENQLRTANINFCWQDSDCELYNFCMDLESLVMNRNFQGVKQRQMADTSIKILLIEDSPFATRHVQEMLEQAQSTHFHTRLKCADVYFLSHSGFLEGYIK